jgi:CPA1 family monovalent cation:H+ antiporter
MTLFESTLLLLAIALVLLRLARRLRVPYPAMLALVGGCVAAMPWVPRVGIEPRLALALFVAPAVMDTAFDMPPRELLRNWLPLTSLAVVLVLLTAAAVAWTGWALEGMPVAAALALGAIVSPPDAAAAAAVLQEFNLPRRTMAILQGESLLNDAVALLIFGVAVGATTAPGAWAESVPGLLIAVPGGALVGAAAGLIAMRVIRPQGGSLASIIAQFLVTYGTWLLADRLHLSSIVAVVALAAVVARYLPGRTSARDRVNSNAVWATVVFVLNVLAFLLMGLQARVIFSELQGAALWHALGFAGSVLAVVIGVRFAWVMTYGWVMRRYRAFAAKRSARPFPVPPARIGVLVSWCGMRGLVTLATAFALPLQFPNRNLIVLSAFTVVLGTLIVQGFTIRPLMALLRIAPDHALADAVCEARSAMLDAALGALAGRAGEAAASLRSEYGAARAANTDVTRPLTDYDGLRMVATNAQRQMLAEWRRHGRIDDDAYHLLEGELDRAELYAASVDQFGAQES